MNGKRLGWPATLGFAATLFLPGLSRAFLCPPAPGEVASSAVKPRGEEASHPGPTRARLARKVVKVSIRPGFTVLARALGHRLQAGWEEEAAHVVPTVASPQLTKPLSIRIFLQATPHNHRAPPPSA
jgi:hypothetical protein